MMTFIILSMWEEVVDNNQGWRLAQPHICASRLQKTVAMLSADFVFFLSDPARLQYTSDCTTSLN